MIRQRLARYTALTFAIAFCATTALAAGNYAFSPPQDWTRTRAGTTSKWMKPGATEIVTLFPTQFGGDLNAFVTHTLKAERAAYPSLHLWTNRNYVICGDHTGRYLIWTASSKGVGKVWEQMLAVWGYDAYVVSYTRPQKSPPSNAARASLLSICGVGSLPVAPGGVPVTAHNNAPPEAAQQGSADDTIDQPAPNPTGTISHPYMPIEVP